MRFKDKVQGQISIFTKFNRKIGTGNENKTFLGGNGHEYHWGGEGKKIRTENCSLELRARGSLFIFMKSS